MLPTQTVIQVEIKGTRPLLQDNIEGSQLDGAIKKKKSTGIKDTPDEWKGKVYAIEGTDKLGHPGRAIERAMEEAGSAFKAGKKGTLRKAVKSSVEVEDLFAVIKGKTKPDYILRSSVVNPNTRGRGFVYRPQFNSGWIISFKLCLSNEDALDKKQAKEVLEYAGQRIGIGAWRPKYGKFEIIKFQET